MLRNILAITVILFTMQILPADANDVGQVENNDGIIPASYNVPEYEVITKIDHDEDSNPFTSEGVAFIRHKDIDVNNYLQGTNLVILSQAFYSGWSESYSWSH